MESGRRRYFLLAGLLSVFLLGGCSQDTDKSPTTLAGGDTAATTNSPNNPDASGGGCEEEAVRSGEGTYYAADGSGNCSFPASPGDLMAERSRGGQSPGCE